MNSFFRICIMILLLMVSFILISNFITETDVYSDHKGGQPGPKVTAVNDEGNAVLSAIIGNSDTTMQTIWVGVVGLTFAGVVLLAWMAHSLTPIGLHIFGVVFWTSYWNMTSIFSYGGYIPLEFIFIITGLMVFLFIAAIIGMLTGSG